MLNSLNTYLLVFSSYYLKLQLSKLFEFRLVKHRIYNNWNFSPNDKPNMSHNGGTYIQITRAYFIEQRYALKKLPAVLRDYLRKPLSNEHVCAYLRLQQWIILVGIAIRLTIPEF